MNERNKEFIGLVALGGLALGGAMYLSSPDEKYRVTLENGTTTTVTRYGRVNETHVFVEPDCWFVDNTGDLLPDYRRVNSTGFQTKIDPNHPRDELDSAGIKIFKEAVDKAGLRK